MFKRKRKIEEYRPHAERLDAAADEAMAQLKAAAEHALAKLKAAEQAASQVPEPPDR